MGRRGCCERELDPNRGRRQQVLGVDRTWKTHPVPFFPHTSIHPAETGNSVARVCPEATKKHTHTQKKKKKNGGFAVHDTYTLTLYIQLAPCS